MSRASSPSRGETWLIDLDPIRGHEQDRVRPCIIVSNDSFNHGPAGLVVVVPVTSRQRGVRLHVTIEPPDGGLRQTSFAMVENIRAVSVERLIERWGRVSNPVLASLEDRLRILIAL